MIHIMGICGTFMGGVAAIAKQAGIDVSGCDENIYPPMSDQLRELGVEITTGYDMPNWQTNPQCVIIGNAMSRGTAAIEYVLDENIPYISGPQWLAEQVLRDRWVLAVSGTHGKTTVTSMLAWILEFAGLKPGFLIGGIANNFGVSARLGEGKFFVIEADEYDSAFFDKRSKFIHYHPKTLIINNLEFDHADIFHDLEEIKKQFHFLVRTVPNTGLIIYPQQDATIQSVLAMGCWSGTTTISLNGDWQAISSVEDGSVFDVIYRGQTIGEVQWSMIGDHNIHNALAAMAAAEHAGVTPEESVKALREFSGVKRRMEVKGKVAGITVYDDFAHHPTAIAATLASLRQKVGKDNIIAVVELGSYTMKNGVHRDHLLPALAQADTAIMAKPEKSFGLEAIVADAGSDVQLLDTTQQIVDAVVNSAHIGDHVLVMSNKGFDGIHYKILQALETA